MPSSWWYALKPLLVDPDLGKLARTMAPSKRSEIVQRDRRLSSVGEASVEERMRRIVRALRTRVTEPELQDEDCGSCDDPSRRN